MSLLGKVLGKKGEDMAERHLVRQGYRILERNYRAARGEIDLIALDQDTVVFVEVKTRTSDTFGAPEDSVFVRKQERMVQAALAYIKNKRLHQMACRFDVIAISRTGTNRIEHIKNAFEMDRTRY